MDNLCTAAQSAVELAHLGNPKKIDITLSSGRRAYHCGWITKTSSSELAILYIDNVLPRMKADGKPVRYILTAVTYPLKTVVGVRLKDAKPLTA